MDPRCVLKPDLWTPIPMPRRPDSLFILLLHARMLQLGWTVDAIRMDVHRDLVKHQSDTASQLEAFPWLAT